MARIRRLGSLIRWIVILLLMTITVNGWRVVFKVASKGDISPASSMLDLWTGSAVVNDNAASFYNTNRTYFAPYQPTYKSNKINNWENNDIKYVKLGLYRDGLEKFFVVFNGTDTNKTSFFDSERILLTSSPDLNSRKLPFTLEGSYDEGRFLMAEDIKNDCSQTRGWFTVIDKDIKRYCSVLTNDTTPYFLYSPTGRSIILKDGDVATSFAIFLDDCVENPCQHEGTCTSLVDGHSCQCVDQVYGYDCQFECPCQYGGKCHSVSSEDIESDGKVVINGTFINDKAITLDDGTQIACKCRQYYTGPHCNMSTLQCASNPCLNYGSCIEGYTYYTCQCNEDYTGNRCQVVRPPKPETGLNTGAKAAIGVCVPLVIIIALVVAYIVYLFRNPEAYEATQKQYTIAREFVRRSIRRMSGRRPKRSDDTKDNVAISPKEKEVHIGQVNLAFDDGGKATYGRQNSEYYDVNANDNAIMSGRTDKYPVINSNKHESAKPNYPNTDSRRNRNDLYKNYQPAELIGGNSDKYPYPGQGYDEYNKLDNQQVDPKAPPRKQQRQTGRRGRQGNANSNESQNNQNTQVPYSPNMPSNTPQGRNKGEYDGNILPMTPRENQHDRDRRQTSSPTYSPQMAGGYNPQQDRHYPHPDRRTPPHQDRQLHLDGRTPPQPQHDRHLPHSDRTTPTQPQHDRHLPHSDRRTPTQPQHDRQLPHPDRLTTHQNSDYQRSHGIPRDRYAGDQEARDYRRPQQNYLRPDDNSHVNLPNYKQHYGPTDNLPNYRQHYDPNENLPNYRQQYSPNNQHSRDTRPPDNKEQRTRSASHGDSNRHPSNDRYQENYLPRGYGNDQRSPGYQVDRSPHDRYDQHSRETEADNTIVFTSSGPMDDVTV